MFQHHLAKLQAAHGRLETRRQELAHRRLRLTRDLAHYQQPSPHDSARQAAGVQNDATLRAIRLATDAELAQVNEALRRISIGEYGLCRDCGQPIAPLRLATLPHAVTCTACAR